MHLLIKTNLDKEIGHSCSLPMCTSLICAFMQHLTDGCFVSGDVVMSQMHFTFEQTSTYQTIRVNFPQVSLNQSTSSSPAFYHLWSNHNPACGHEGWYIKPPRLEISWYLLCEVIALWSVWPGELWLVTQNIIYTQRSENELVHIDWFVLRLLTCLNRFVCKLWRDFLFRVL